MCARPPRCLSTVLTLDDYGKINSIHIINVHLILRSEIITKMHIIIRWSVILKLVYDIYNLSYKIYKSCILNVGTQIRPMLYTLNLNIIYHPQHGCLCFEFHTLYVPNFGNWQIEYALWIWNDWANIQRLHV